MTRKSSLLNKGILKNRSTSYLQRLKGDYQPWQRLLPYQSFCEQDGVFYNERSQGFIIELSPLVGACDETVTLLSSMMVDNVHPKMLVQFLLWASPDIGTSLDAFYQARCGQNPLFEKLAKKRRQYLSNRNLVSLTQNGNALLRDFKLYCVVSMPSIAQASQHLIKVREQIFSSLSSLTIAHSLVTARGFIALMQSILMPLAGEQATWDPHQPLNQQIVHPEAELKVFSDELILDTGQQPWSVHALTVKQFPNDMHQSWMANSIGRLCDPTNALQVPSPFILSLTLKIFDLEQSARQSQWQWLQKDRDARSPLARFMPTLAQTRAEWDEVRQRVRQGARLVKGYFQAMTIAPAHQRQKAPAALKDIFRANGWQLKSERYLQLPAFLSVLPMLASEGLWEDVKRMGRVRTLTSEQAIHIAPLQGEWKGMNSNRLLLPGRRGQMAFWDPFAHQESNYNVAIAARSGGGKSAFTQEYIVAQLTSGAKIWVIDVGRSYEKTCEFLKGQFIAFNPQSKFSLNPFTTIKDIDESLTLLKPLLATMARPSGNIQDEESAYLEKAIKAAWQAKGHHADITTVADWLAEQEDRTCQNLSHLLFAFTKEGMYSAYFNGPCAFKQDNPFIVLELEELKSKKDLQKIILLLLMYHISEQMYLGSRQQCKSCIIDEAWDLLSDENRAAANFIETGFRRARRYNANFVTITQSINDYFKHPTALAAFENAFWKVILGQEPESIEQLRQQGKFKLDSHSEMLLKSIHKTKDYAECFVKAGNHTSVHRIIFDPTSRVLYSSKGDEYEAVKSLQSQGKTLFESIEIVAKQYE